ncbi:MAG TPA: beta-propeller fold lactonase family protein, partial [Terriglobales bacterium]|nr:beta-propeller fold lactonase family protein [Terriglobales bacterium]
MHRRRLLWLATVALFTFTNCGGGGSSSQSGAGGNNNNGNGGTGGSASTEVLYAAYGTPDGIVAGFILPLQIGPTGKLTALKSVPGPWGAVSIVTDPTLHFLYSSDFNSEAVFGYSIDPITGNLTPLAGSPYSTGYVGFGNGGALAIDPVGNFLFFTDSFGDIVTFIRNSDGTLTPSAASVTYDTNQPVQMVVDPAGKFLYASNHADYPNGGQISVFLIDTKMGALSPVAGSPFTFAQQNSEPWGLAMNSQGTYLFNALSNVNSVAALSVNGSTGGVTQVSGSPFQAARNPEQLILSPSGKFLYVGNTGSGGISTYSVDEILGKLKL